MYAFSFDKVSTMVYACSQHSHILVHLPTHWNKSELAPEEPQEGSCLLLKAERGEALRTQSVWSSTGYIVFHSSFIIDLFSCLLSLTRALVTSLSWSFSHNLSLSFPAYNYRMIYGCTWAFIDVITLQQILVQDRIWKELLAIFLYTALLSCTLTFCTSTWVISSCYSYLYSSCYSCILEIVWIH